jgi:hypothetical protein
MAACMSMSTNKCFHFSIFQCRIAHHSSVRLTVIILTIIVIIIINIIVIIITIVPRELLS